MKTARVFLPAAAFLLLCACIKKETVVIYATADPEGNYYSESDHASGSYAGGFSALKSLYSREKLPAAAVNLGSRAAKTPAGLLNKGKAVTERMNEIPYTLSSVGYEDALLQDNDFDSMMSMSSFTVLSSNLYRRNGKDPENISRYCVKRIGNYKIGFISLLIADPDRVEAGHSTRSLRMENVSYAASVACNLVNGAGADATVLLVDVNPSKTVPKKFYETLLQLIPRVDIVIADDAGLDGTAVIGDTYIIPASRGMKKADRIKIKFNTINRKISAVSAGTVNLKVRKEEAAASGAELKYLEAERNYFGRRVGELKEPLAYSPDKQSAAADFLADCSRKWARTDAALIPFSDISSGMKAGPVLMKDLYRSFPGDSSLVFVKINGANLSDLFSGGPFPALAVSGLKIYEKNGRVQKILTENGKALEKNKLYTVAVSDGAGGIGRNILLRAYEFSNSRKNFRDIVRYCLPSGKAAAYERTERVVYEND